MTALPTLRAPDRPDRQSARRLLPWGTAVAALGIALWLNLANLGVPTWRYDELVYRDAGWAYLHGNLTSNREHPPLGKYLIGVVELAAGRGTDIRVVAVVASLVTGAILAAFAWRLAGRLAAAVALAAWTLLPHAVQGGVVRLDRFLFLDPLMAAWATGALYLAYRRRPWLAGLLLGAAVATKVPGALYLPGVLVLVGAAWWRALAAAVAAFAAAYAPYGTGALDALRYMVDFQDSAAAHGHPVLVAGHHYLHAPWWSHLWWQWQAYDGVGCAVLVVAAVATVGLVPDRRTTLALVLAVLVPLAALSAHGVKLPYYFYDWQPPLTLLAAVGLVAMLRRAGGLALRDRLAGAAALAGLAVLASLAGSAGHRVAAEMPADYALLPGVVPAHGRVAVWGFASVASAYLPHRDVVAATPQTVATSPVVVVDRRQAAAAPRPALERALRAGPERRVVQLRGGLTVYEQAG